MAAAGKLDPRLPSRPEHYGVRRVPAAQQRPVPRRSGAQRRQQRGERQADRTTDREPEAEAGRKMHRADQGRKPARGMEFEPQGRGAAQTRAKIRLPLVPPNPNELDIAVRTSVLRAAFGT